MGSWGKNKPWGGFWCKCSLSGLCGLLEESEIALQLCVGHVLRARSLILQFLKTAFFVKRAATERKKGLRISVFFSVFIYNIGNNKVLCVLLGGEQALTRQTLCGSSVGCWRGNKP